MSKRNVLVYLTHFTRHQPAGGLHTGSVFKWGIKPARRSQSNIKGDIVEGYKQSVSVFGPLATRGRTPAEPSQAPLVFGQFSLTK